MKILIIDEGGCTLRDEDVARMLRYVFPSVEFIRPELWFNELLTLQENPSKFDVAIIQYLVGVNAAHKEQSEIVNQIRASSAIPIVLVSCCCQTDENFRGATNLITVRAHEMIGAPPKHVIDFLSTALQCLPACTSEEAEKEYRKSQKRDDTPNILGTLFEAWGDYDVERWRKKVEKALIAHVLKKTSHDHGIATGLLGLSMDTLSKLMEEDQ